MCLRVLSCGFVLYFVHFQRCCLCVFEGGVCVCLMALLVYIYGCSLRMQMPVDCVCVCAILGSFRFMRFGLLSGDLGFKNLTRYM